MKKFVVVVAVMFAVTALTGCGKKKQDSASMDALNGVVSENVVSVGEPAANGAVPVIVENAEAVPAAAAGEMAAGAGASEKPTAKQIQQALKNAGFYTGKVDGTVGPKTRKAIEAFQSQNGLKADGKVGAKTWKLLSAHLNSASEVANPSAAEQAPAQQ